MGMPANVDSLLTTQPYYRSTYVFVAQKPQGIKLSRLMIRLCAT
jgi:hypothetical protein